METYTTHIRFRLRVNDSGELKERISRLRFSPLFFEHFETMFIIINLRFSNYSIE